MFGISSQVSLLAGMTYRALYPTVQFLTDGYLQLFRSCGCVLDLESEGVCICGA